MREGILILDFGSQYTQLIARRIREMGGYCEIFSGLHLEKTSLTFVMRGIILSGGPASVNASDAPQPPDWIFETTVPILGICYGMQVLAHRWQGVVLEGAVCEYGEAWLTYEPSCPLFEGFDAQPSKVWMSHGDHVQMQPPSFKIVASTEDTPIAAIAHEARPWYGVQFHPEVTHTSEGQRLLQNFVIKICQLPLTWTTSSVMVQLIDEIRRQVGSERVLLALSGGVDSSVLALLLHQAIGDQLTCVFVDTGLLRLNEVQQVQTMFEPFHLKMTVVDARAIFLKALEGIDCPESKRKKIGHTFIDVFVTAARACSNMTWFAQGTIYPDVIESAQAGGALIKSHHNVGGLPEHLPFKLLEPLRQLFKDEVRALGRALGLPSMMLDRHPFPGPGLAVRILGELHHEYLTILKHADDIFISMLREAQLYQTVSQAFAVFLPIRSVGVMGDNRRYDFVIALRAVVTDDFMTAHWARLPWDFLSDVSHRIMNEVKGVSRVVYDISGKPPATIEWE